MPGGRIVRDGMTKPAVPQEGIMGMTAIFNHRGQIGARKSRRRDESSRRIDIVVGLLAASAIVAVFIVAYFTFGSVDVPR
jgi:hypothetical protein